MKPLIIVVNDDGIDSAGLAAVARAAARHGEILICAPHTQQTSMGRAYPRTADMGVIEEADFDPYAKAYAVHGSPAYAAAHGILELADRAPALLVSGINIGANLGRSITCSGTLGACMEADSEGIPSVAFSLESPPESIRRTDYGEELFQYAEQSADYWIGKILAEGMPRDCNILNVNVPAVPVAPECYRITRLDPQNYYWLERPGKRDRSRKFELEFTIRWDEATLLADGDIRAVCLDRITSVTPLGWDLTKEQEGIRDDGEE